MEQILSSGNHHNSVQKRRLYDVKKLNQGLVTENEIIVQADKGER
jgi:hypothetical protein